MTWEVVRWTLFALVAGPLIIVLQGEDPTLKQWVLWEVVFAGLGLFFGIVWVRGWKQHFRELERRRRQKSDSDEPKS